MDAPLLSALQYPSFSLSPLFYPKFGSSLPRIRREVFYNRQMEIWRPLAPYCFTTFPRPTTLPADNT